MRSLSALALLVAAACPSPAAGEDGRTRIETARYVLESSGPREEAEEWGRMLEAAWTQYGAFFGKEPKLKKGERLRVAFFEDDAPWRAAARSKTIPNRSFC